MRYIARKEGREGLLLGVDGSRIHLDREVNGANREDAVARIQ
jgi:hypothetical protein